MNATNYTYAFLAATALKQPFPAVMEAGGSVDVMNDPNAASGVLEKRKEVQSASFGLIMGGLLGGVVGFLGGFAVGSGVLKK